MTEIIADTAALHRCIERIRQAPRVAIDTEFHQERSYAARLMVIQAAFADEVAIIDPLAFQNAELALLAEAFAEKLVVGHALSGDLRIFADRFDIVPNRIFDCQVAAAFCGFGPSISLLDVVLALTGTRLKKSQTVSDWSQRPFTEKQIEYLVDDVAHLFTMQDELTARLQKNGRWAWAQAEMEPLGDIRAYRPDPDRLFLKLQGASRMNRRELGVLREIARLRDRLARERDVPPKYIFPDDVVTGLVSLRPQHVEDLSQLRRLDSGMRKSFGAAIVEAVQHAMQLTEAELPERPARLPSLQRDAIVSLCAVLVHAVAAENDVPSSLLAPRAALERVARELPADRARMEEVLELTSWRAELLAQPLLDLLWGKTSLSIVDTSKDAPRIVAFAAQPDDLPVVVEQ